MNKARLIKKGLEKTGRQVVLEDGSWSSTPFYAVLRQKWKSYKSDFEFSETEIGRVSADYCIYIGPYDHDITALSDDAVLCVDGFKYIFKKKETEKIGGETVYYSGIVRRIWEDESDKS